MHNRSAASVQIGDDGIDAREAGQRTGQIICASANQ